MQALLILSLYNLLCHLEKTQSTQASGWDKQQREDKLIMNNSLWQTLVDYTINYNFRLTNEEVDQTPQDLSNCSLFMKVLQTGLFRFWIQQIFKDMKIVCSRLHNFILIFPYGSRLYA